LIDFLAEMPRCAAGERRSEGASIEKLEALGLKPQDRVMVFGEDDQGGAGKDMARGPAALAETAVRP
jgi:hypothetical protein